MKQHLDNLVVFYPFDTLREHKHNTQYNRHTGLNCEQFTINLNRQQCSGADVSLDECIKHQVKC